MHPAAEEPPWLSGDEHGTKFEENASGSWFTG